MENLPHLNAEKLLAITMDSFADMILGSLRADGYDLTADLIEKRVARYRNEAGYPEELPCDMEPVDE